MNPQLHSDLFELRPGRRVNFHALADLSSFVSPALFAGQQYLFKSWSCLARFYKSDQFIHSVQKLIKRLKFFHGDGLKKYAVDTVAALVPPVFG